MDQPSSPPLQYPLLGSDTLLALLPEHLTQNLTDLVNYYGDISRLLESAQNNEPEGEESDHAIQLAAWLNRVEEQVHSLLFLFSFFALSLFFLFSFSSLSLVFLSLSHPCLLSFFLVFSLS
jgi:hypothetical protein